MKKYPRQSNGQKAGRIDFNDGWTLAGRADDYARAPLLKVPVETTNRRGWAIPFRDGPIVLPSGSGNGKVLVQPFTAVMSAAGASSNGGTENASDGSDGSLSAIDDVVSAWYAGGLSPAISVQPTSGYMRWDLLYAIVAQTDSDSAARLVKDPSTKVISSQNVYTRHKPTVTLAWAQGTEVSTGASGYGSGNLPALPTPAAGQAVIPLALVLVSYAATMSTAQYTRDHIANCGPRARINPQTGAMVAAIAGIAGRTGVQYGSRSWSAKDVISGNVSEGGWPLSGSANTRPPSFAEPGAGGIDLWIPIGPFSTTGGQESFGGTLAGWKVLSTPIKASNGDVYGDELPWDFRNRWFFAEAYLRSDSSKKFAHDLSATALTGVVPTGADSGAGANYGVSHVVGHSFRVPSGTPFGAGYMAAAQWIDVNGNTGDYLALLVNQSTGALHLAGSNGNGTLNAVRGLIHLRASPQLYPYNL